MFVGVILQEQSSIGTVSSLTYTKVVYPAIEVFWYEVMEVCQLKL